MHFSGLLLVFGIHGDADIVKGFYPVKDKESYYGILSDPIAASICWFLQFGISNLGKNFTFVGLVHKGTHTFLAKQLEMFLKVFCDASTFCSLRINTKVLPTTQSWEKTPNQQQQKKITPTSILIFP